MTNPAIRTEEAGLEKLAVSLGKSFLNEARQSGDPGRVIILRGSNQGTLSLLKEYMDCYFSKKREEVSVQIGGDQGYIINVDAFIH